MSPTYWETNISNKVNIILQDNAEHWSAPTTFENKTGAYQSMILRIETVEALL